MFNFIIFEDDFDCCYYEVPGKPYPMRATFVPYRGWVEEEVPWIGY